MAATTEQLAILLQELLMQPDATAGRIAAVETGMTTFVSTMASKDEITSGVSRSLAAQKEAFYSLVELPLSGLKGETDVKMIEPINARIVGIDESFNVVEEVRRQPGGPRVQTCQA